MKGVKIKYGHTDIDGNFYPSADNGTFFIKPSYYDLRKAIDIKAKQTFKFMAVHGECIMIYGDTEKAWNMAHDFITDEFIKDFFAL